MNNALNTVSAAIKIITPIILLLILTPGISVGAIYKWVDADGKTHYGNQPPESIKVEKLNIKVKEPVVPPKSIEATDGKTPASPQDKTRAAPPAAPEAFDLCIPASVQSTCGPLPAAAPKAEGSSLLPMRGPPKRS